MSHRAIGSWSEDFLCWTNPPHRFILSSKFDRSCWMTDYLYARWTSCLRPKNGSLYRQILCLEVIEAGIHDVLSKCWTIFSPRYVSQSTHRQWTATFSSVPISVATLWKGLNNTWIFLLSIAWCKSMSTNRMQKTNQSLWWYFLELMMVLSLCQAVEVNMFPFQSSKTICVAFQHIFRSLQLYRIIFVVVHCVVCFFFLLVFVKDNESTNIRVLNRGFRIRQGWFWQRHPLYTNLLALKRAGSSFQPLQNTPQRRFIPMPQSCTECFSCCPYHCWIQSIVECKVNKLIQASFACYFAAKIKPWGKRKLCKGGWVMLVINAGPNMERREQSIWTAQMSVHVSTLQHAGVQLTEWERELSTSGLQFNDSQTGRRPASREKLVKHHALFRGSRSIVRVSWQQLAQAFYERNILETTESLALQSLLLLYVNLSLLAIKNHQEQERWQD